jgi:hypothetical protein
MSREYAANQAQVTHRQCARENRVLADDIDRALPGLTYRGVT